MNILGISAFYHDSAAALIRDGEIIAAAQEERFTRKKHDSTFPRRSIAYCLKEGGVQLEDLDGIVFYDKPFLKFERLLETQLSIAPLGFANFLKSMPIWLTDKLFLKQRLRSELHALCKDDKPILPEILFTEHHHAHAASCYFPSPYENAAVLCLDGVGEWATSSAWVGNGAQLEKVWEINFPHSLGLLYSAFTSYCGFKVNSGEYKLMGLAPYGRPKFVDAIRNEMISIKGDGSFQMNMEYFSYLGSQRMFSPKFCALLGAPARVPESTLTQFYMDVACSVQRVTEEIIVGLVRKLRSEVGSDNLCLAGGVALNCVANGRLRRENIFSNIWIQPAAGDAGGALGAAFIAYHQYHHNPRNVGATGDSMKGSRLGPDIDEREAERYFRSIGAKYHAFDSEHLTNTVADHLADGKIIGWCRGRMEFGPRALGARSILADARPAHMQSTLNQKIKFRESFRPFAALILQDYVKDYFEFEGESPYMLMTCKVQVQHRGLPHDPKPSNCSRSSSIDGDGRSIPAVTHVDHSTRVQTLDETTDPVLFQLLSKFHDRTSCPLLVNTSLNVRSEPMASDYRDAYRCFMRTDIDFLVVGNLLLSKEEQSPLPLSECGEYQHDLD